MNAIATIPTSNAEVYRASTDAADMCKEIVVATAMVIDKRKYVKVEGWQAIAIAHGCTGSARDVERVEGGVRAIGEIRRMSDGAIIAEAEGFVGEDEPTWFGGETEKDEWVNGQKTGKKIRKVLPKRADYAIRAMAQTRAISRACRSAFAHVVVMMNAGLSTTPAEEVPDGGFGDEPRGEPRNVTPRSDQRTGSTSTKSGDAGADADALDAEMDACKSKRALLAWEQFRLKEIGRLSKANGDKLCAKFTDLMAKLPEETPESEAKTDLGITDDDIPE
jgi:hypothetical protein